MTGAGFPAGGGDVINFSVGAWGVGATPANAGFTSFNGTAIPLPALAILGLTEGDATTPVPAGTDASFGNPVTGEQIIQPGTTVVELSQNETGAVGLAQYLHSAAGRITFAGGGLAADSAAHILFAYSDGANVHIADVEFVNTGPAPNGGVVAAAAGPELTTNAVDIITTTDMVQLTGVASVAALNTHNVHSWPRL